MSEVDPKTARARLIESLERSDAYPHKISGPIERVSTHISDIMLAGDFAYKIKKPVNFGFCDFSTPQIRKSLSKRELELNQRLSRNVYLSVEPIKVDGTTGQYRIDNQGTAIDWALKMRRLHAEDQLDHLLDLNRAGGNEIEQIANLLAGFHSDAAPAPPEFGNVPGVSGIVLSNLDRVAEHAPAELDINGLVNNKAYTEAFLEQRGDLISSRHEQGAPRMCHGDLHAGNIFIETENDGQRRIQIIDCIEFNDSFVYIDPAADLAFLSMDLKRRNRYELAELLVEKYIEESGDIGIRPLLAFYESYRAMVRCMAASISAKQSEISKRQIHVENAKAYLQLANEIASSDRPQFVAVMAGVTGTGKSTVAKVLADQWNAVHLQTDVIRREIAGMTPTGDSGSGLHSGIYTREMSERTYREMFRRAEAALADGKSVVMDGTHLRREFRRKSLQVARNTGAVTAIIECNLPESEALDRLETRYSSGTSESEGRPEVYARQTKSWQSVSENEAQVVAHVDTGKTEEELAKSLFSQLWNGLLAKSG